MNQLPYISVIITAYNRKKYLLNAIKSVISQTLDKKYYEIIVIKNYNDEAIDNFINANNIKNIVMDGTIGEFLYAGVTGASGEVISFLDDDDLFFHNKLEIIFNKFKRNNIVYYHNDHTTINENGENLAKPVSDNIIFNLSSISIIKDNINYNNLRKIVRNPDDFMYLSALESNKKFIKGKEKLTYYRLHSSASNFIVSNINEFKKYKLEFLNSTLNQFLDFKKLFSSKQSRQLINVRISYIEIDMYVLYLGKKPEHIMNIFKNDHEPFSTLVMLFLSYLLVRMHNNFSDIVLTRLWNTYKNESTKKSLSYPELSSYIKIII